MNHFKSTMEHSVEYCDLVSMLKDRAANFRVRYVRPFGDSGGYAELTGPQLESTSATMALNLRGFLPTSSKEWGNSKFVPLVIQDPLWFVVSFFAVVRAGCVPIPAPALPHLHRGHLARLTAITRTSKPYAYITDQDDVEGLLEGQDVLKVDDLARPGDHATTIDLSVPETAYVQYTSGSLSAPKPVLLGQRNVLAQLRQAATAFGEEQGSVSVNWVPLYHDMGLVTSVLRPLWSGYTSVILDPFEFVRNPSLWTRVMTDWRATHTSSPDFGYSLAARKTLDIEGLDLSSLKVARSAGEPVRFRTLRAFSERFGRVGFAHSAFKPSYGLAEATLTVTSCPLDEPPKILEVSGKALRTGRALPMLDASDACSVVSCGPPIEGTRVKVLEPVTGAQLAHGELGELWISGPQVAPLAQGAFEIDGVHGYRTGDIGFVHDSEVYLVGRAKERFQVSGENHYSVDVENVVQTLDPRIRAGRVAVFLGCPEGKEEPVPLVMAECTEGLALGDSEGERLSMSIISRVGRDMGLSIRCVWLVPARTLPVTTSGKIQRNKCRDLFERGAVETLYRFAREGT